MLIRVLPEHTANRIAAGEVIERPAAAIKELVENSLDAGATKVRVSIEGGGIARMMVEDNGAGMAADDLAICIERHATSKLPTEEDLFRIDTLGFRGEALPSIGSVSKLSITSRTNDGDAYTISVNGGHKTEVRPASGAPGTRIVVEDLFYVVPARRKFLKQARTEAEHVAETIRRLAIAWPNVSFSLEADGRESLNFKATANASDRIREVLGSDFAAAAVEVHGAWPNMTMSGLAGLPIYHRATGAEQYLIVNKRPVRDNLLKTALKVAYRDVITSGRHAACAIFLTIPPEEIDVNVHPGKAELRYHNQSAVQGAMISCLRRAISIGAGTVAIAADVEAATRLRYGGVGYKPSFAPRPFPAPYPRAAGTLFGGQRAPGLKPDAPISPHPQLIDDTDGSPSNSLRAQPANFGAAGQTQETGNLPPHEMAQAETSSGALDYSGGNSATVQASENSSADNPAVKEPSALSGAAVSKAPTWSAGCNNALNFATSPKSDAIAENLIVEPSSEVGGNTNLSGPEFPLGRPIAQLYETYILAEGTDGGLLLIDQHAAHERLTHETLREQMAKGGAQAQLLLLPAVIDLPAEDCERLTARAEDLAKLGFEVENFGIGAVLVRSMPAMLKDADIRQLVLDMASEIASWDETTALDTKIDAAIARLACHGSIRAGRKLSTPEMSALMREMERTPRAMTCSHGRPTVLSLTRGSLEKMFNRK